ncbi:hypothetical protein [Bradyrhizobium cenepequi]
MMVFDDEREAHAAWDRAKDNWTCTLFETSARKFEWRAGGLRQLQQPVAQEWLELADELSLVTHQAGKEWGYWSLIDRAEKTLRLAAQSAQLQQDPAATTPAARWREQGKPDPHSIRYDCERAQTAGGHLTDDEVANAVFLHPSIENLTIAKDRVRWLSRQLAAQSGQPQSVADSIIGQIEERFPNWRSYRDLVDCIDCTLHDLRNSR